MPDEFAELREAHNFHDIARYQPVHRDAMVSESDGVFVASADYDALLAAYDHVVRERNCLTEAIKEQFLLQYGKEPDNIQSAVNKLLEMRKDRKDIDDVLQMEKSL